MVFADAVRTALALAATASDSLQEEIVHEAYTGPSDDYGKAGYSAATVPAPKAFVQRKEGTIRDDKGVEVRVAAALFFPRPVAIGPRDRITLSDGLTGPIIFPQGGGSDPSTGQPFARTVYLGARS